ncbi:hypothetical protein SteCoe_33923 [Stentor coeruleus]|uniref:non-specific serine/threonine protein kinase n=1 Tax=Stentor coeruleus TaxID=5963 RepID=A0A1R2AVM2_9CILI|nr:hypothetical protein SteCoe_33923 [Stentor coeruleus]
MGCCASDITSAYLAPRLCEGASNSTLPFVRHMSSIRDHYTVLKCLGTGNFGSVYLIKDKRCGIERIAKELIKSLVNPNITTTLEQELTLIKQIDHPCIVKIYEIIETSSRIYIITEYLNGGILFDKYSEHTKISETLAARYILEIALALDCIHKFKIIHRDIKPTNLLFESEAPDSHIKLIDFCIMILEKKQDFYGDSVQYMAPEAFNGISTTKSYIWSTGIILYSMLSGTMPFHAENHEKIANLIQTSTPDYFSSIWMNVTPEALNLVQRMLSRNPKDRPTAQQLLSDPWIMAYNRNTLRDTPFEKNVHDSIVKLNAQINLVKAIFSFISNQVLNSKDLKKLKEMFRSFDKDGSGTLSIIEVNNGYDSVGLPPPASVIELMKKLDTDDSGSIDYAEFLKGSEQWAKLAMKRELEIAAKKYEKGSDAKISLLELIGTIPDIQGTEWMERLRLADVNGDGYITLEELKNYLETEAEI